MTMTRAVKNKPGRAETLHTLAIDIGGTGLKASVLDRDGKMISDRVRIPTPHPCPPEKLLSSLKELVEPLPAFDRISVGFPGVIRHGATLTAAHFGNELWCGFPLERRIADTLGKPTRLLNDAEVQGLGIIKGAGLEVVITLGTGVGSAIYSEGRLTPHLELAHHPLKGGKTYDEYLGEATRKKIGKKKWNKRVHHMIEVLAVVTNYDTLYLGGGNSHHVHLDLPSNVILAGNSAGITGGIRLWEGDIWSAIKILD